MDVRSTSQFMFRGRVLVDKGEMKGGWTLFMTAEKRLEGSRGGHTWFKVKCPDACVLGYIVEDNGIGTPHRDA